jgi:hypothetical protein
MSLALLKFSGGRQIVLRWTAAAVLEAEKDFAD